MNTKVFASTFWLLLDYNKMSLVILMVRRVRLTKDASIYFILSGQAIAPLPGPPTSLFV